jgi:CysZ protein
MIFNDFLKALGQIDDRAFRGVLLRALGLTMLLLAGFIYVFSVLMGWVLPDQISLPWIGVFTVPDALGNGVGFGAGLILSVFLMIPVASVFVGAFLDQIAGAVETKHYPTLPVVKGPGLGETILDSLRFLGLVVFVNLLALVLYLVFVPFAAFIFWAVNGFLLGREYFQMVALRRLDLKSANALRRQNFFGIWIAGTLMAVPLTVPVLNLIVPILGVATFTHQFHRYWQASQTAPR